MLLNVACNAILALVASTFVEVVKAVPAPTLKDSKCSNDIPGTTSFYDDQGSIAPVYANITPPAGQLVFVGFAAGFQNYTCSNATKLWVNTALSGLVDKTNCSNNGYAAVHSYQVDPTTTTNPGLVPSWNVFNMGTIYAKPAVKLPSPDNSTQNIAAVLLNVTYPPNPFANYVVRASTLYGQYGPSAKNMTCDPSTDPTDLNNAIKKFYEAYYYFYKS